MPTISSPDGKGAIPYPRQPSALSEDDLYRLPSLSIVLRSWPNSPGPDMPEVYRKNGGWWTELTDRSNDYQLSTGVIWSNAARFTLVHRATADDSAQTDRMDA